MGPEHILSIGILLSFIFLNISLYEGSKNLCRSIQSINFNHNRKIKLLFKHDAIEKIALTIFKAPNILKGLSFCFTSAIYSRSLHFLKEYVSKAPAVGIQGHNECIVYCWKLIHDHWQDIKTESQNLWERTEHSHKNDPSDGLLLWVMWVLFYSSSHFKCMILSSEMHSFNFPGGSWKVWVVKCEQTYMCAQNWP